MSPEKPEPQSFSETSGLCPGNSRSGATFTSWRGWGVLGGRQVSGPTVTEEGTHRGGWAQPCHLQPKGQWGSEPRVGTLPLPSGVHSAAPGAGPSRRGPEVRMAMEGARRKGLGHVASRPLDSDFPQVFKGLPPSSMQNSVLRSQRPCSGLSCAPPCRGEAGPGAGTRSLEAG